MAPSGLRHPGVRGWGKLGIPKCRCARIGMGYVNKLMRRETIEPGEAALTDEAFAAQVQVQRGEFGLTSAPDDAFGQAREHLVERSMREESNDWFGVMRFHDIELIM